MNQSKLLGMTLLQRVTHGSMTKIITFIKSKKVGNNTYAVLYKKVGNNTYAVLYNAKS